MKKTLSFLLSLIMVFSVFSVAGIDAYASSVQAPSFSYASGRPAGFYVAWKTVADADGYQVQFATLKDFSNAAIKEVDNGSATGVTVNGRAWERNYYVRVRAFVNDNNGKTVSPWSVTKTVATRSGNEADPTYIKSITPLPAAFSVSVNPVANADGYEVKYATKADFSNAKINTYDAKSTELLVNKRAQDCKYNVQVRTYRDVDGKRYYSLWGAIGSVKTLSYEEVQAPKLSGVNPRPAAFYVSWYKVSGVDGYQIQFATRTDFGNAAIKTVADPDCESVTVDKRASETAYSVRVRAYKDSNGETLYSPWSSTKRVTTRNGSEPYPTYIKSLTPLVSSFGVEMNKVSGVDGYQVRYATKSDFSNGKIDTFKGVDNFDVVVTKRAQECKYYVQVRTYRETGGKTYYSAWGAISNVTTKKDPRYPYPVSINSLTGAVNGFTVKWNKSSDADGYEIRFATKQDFSNAAIWTASASETSKLINKRASETRYYVQIRAYKTYESQKYYSSWSETKSVVTLSDYANELRKAGFPESYIKPLVQLHQQHPSWIFKPLQTGYDWEYAVSQERTPHSQQLIYKNVEENMLCKCSKCYKDGKYVMHENGTMPAASEYAVKYYMDPRNWMTERYMFQFESTAYDGTHTQAGVESILKGTWMHNSKITYKDKNGKEKTINKKYSDVIMQAANDSGLSAYYLASKIKQEVGGANPTAGGASGTNKTYPGIYNYYNIGAYTGYLDGLKWASASNDGYYTNTDCNVRADATTNSSKVVYVPYGTKVTFKEMVNGKAPDNGYKWYKVSLNYEGKSYNGYIRADLVHSPYGRPWDTPEKSIYNGAMWIAENYMSQNTGYLQKFNVNPISPEPFAHEYMAYVAAASQESSHLYDGYKNSGTLELTRTFVIPVYKNMPESTK